MSSTIQKKTLYTVVILACLIVITLIIFPKSDPITVKDTTLTQANETIEVVLPPNISTIATAWQWETEQTNESVDQHANTSDMDSKSQTDTATKFPFTQASIYEALQAVKLNGNGDIIIDNDALEALNTALDHSNIKLDEESLEALQDLIKKGLPGNAGEQTAQIVADFYQYLGAEREFNSLYETTNNEEQNIEEYETQYNELIALRELYLGDVVAGKLFSTSDANSRYMFESMKLEADTNLSEEEKKQQQAKIIERHAEESINVKNWNERYQAFSENKQTILSASISNDQKRNQLTSLMHQHFTDEELSYVDHLKLNSL
jgi:lipase chaperone LimK